MVLGGGDTQTYLHLGKLVIYMSKSEVDGREFQCYWLKIADCLYSEDEIYTYNPKHDDALIHVIEFEAYNKAVEALKVAQKEIQRLNVDAPLELTITTGLINLELIETLRELGVE